MADQENITSTFKTVERLTMATRESENLVVLASLGEADLYNEMDKIEKCASTGHNYAYNPDWPQSQIAQLTEYAAVVNLKGKMIPVKATSEDKVLVEDDSTMKQLASISMKRPEASADLRLALGDPFKLAELNDDAKEFEKWEKVSPEQKLASSPDQNSKVGSIMPIRGEFQYETQKQLKVRAGENSLANPDAIGQLSKEQDTGERLKAENATHARERKAAKSAWQTELVQKAKATGAGALSRGNVFMTGSIPEKQQNSGIELEAAVNELETMESPLLPNSELLTDGEKLHQANIERKNNIQRTASSDDWQKVRGSKRPSLDDAFAEALEFQMGRMGIDVTSN